MELFEQLKNKITGQNKTIVFPEGEDPRIQGAAIRLAADNLIEPILLGDAQEISKTAQAHNFDLSNIHKIKKHDVSISDSCFFILNHLQVQLLWLCPTHFTHETITNK